MESHYATGKATAQSIPCVQPTALKSLDFVELISACVQIQAGTAPQIYTLQFKSI